MFMYMFSAFVRYHIITFLLVEVTFRCGETLNYGKPKVPYLPVVSRENKAV